jgi:chromosome segregation ATPase
MALCVMPGATYYARPRPSRLFRSDTFCAAARTVGPLAAAHHPAANGNERQQLRRELEKVNAKYLRRDAQAKAAVARSKNLQQVATEAMAQLKKCMAVLEKTGQRANQTVAELCDMRKAMQEQQEAFQRERQELRAQLASYDAHARAADVATERQWRADEAERQALFVQLSAHEQSAAAAEVREEELLAYAADAAEAVQRADAEIAALHAQLEVAEAAAELATSQHVYQDVDQHMEAPRRQVDTEPARSQLPREERRWGEERWWDMRSAGQERFDAEARRKRRLAEGYRKALGAREVRQAMPQQDQEGVPHYLAPAAPDELSAHTMVERLKEELNLEGSMTHVVASACEILGVDRGAASGTSVVDQLRVCYGTLFIPGVDNNNSI